MQIKNSLNNFGLISKVLHWIIAILIIGLICLGWYMVDLSYYDKWYHKLLTWHKSLGMLVLGMAVIKVAWQSYSSVPKLTGRLKIWERISANVMHKVLLLIMVLIPITGYLISSSDGKDVAVFNWFEIPSLISKHESLRNLAIELHFYFSYGIVLLLIGHIGAALKHQFIDKDGTLVRMLWK